MEAHVRDVYPQFIDGYEFDEDFLVFVAENALYRMNHPLMLRMTPEQRARMTAGRNQTFSKIEPSNGPQDTPPLHQHPDYRKVKYGDVMDTVPPPPVPASSSSSSSKGTAPKSAGKGKGSCKGTFTGKGKQQDVWRSR